MLSHPSIITRRVLLAGAAALIAAPKVAHAAEASYRYWRFEFLEGNQGGGNLGLSEVQMRTTAGGANVASGGTATAFSFIGGYEPSKAFDGITSSDYVANGAGVSQWLQYDFGAGNGKIIKEITIRCRDSFSENVPIFFNLIKSNDATAWFPGWRGTLPTSSSGLQTTFTRPDSSFLSGGHRYYKFIFLTMANANLNGRNLQAAKIGFKTVTDAVDITVMAYGTADDSQVGFMPYRALDDRASSKWARGVSALAPWWFLADFGPDFAPQISQFSITASTDFPQETAGSGSVAFSDDGSSFTSLGNFSTPSWTSGEIKILNLTFPPSTRRRGIILP